MDWHEKRVLLTGISGFVAPLIAEKLLDMGAEVSGLIRRKSHETSPKRIREVGIEDNIQLIEGDLTDLACLGHALDISEPDVVFHLGAQSYVPYSFSNPTLTLDANITGTSNLLEAIRFKNFDPTFVFAGSSEEYGLVLTSDDQYRRAIEKFGSIFPPPREIPEIPTNEDAPLRPMSPYGVSKVAGDYLTRNYCTTYGLKTIVSRAFNHEGAGRGVLFVTSTIVNQSVSLKLGEVDKIRIGNISAFRDWSHVSDVVQGYIKLAEAGVPGEVYNQGSMRTNSVLTYLLWSLEELGFEVNHIETINGSTKVANPTDPEKKPIFGLKFDKTKVDQMILDEDLSFSIEDQGLIVSSPQRKIRVEFDEARFRPSDVPILLSDSTKVSKIGVRFKQSVKSIIRDQMNYFLSGRNRQL